jgi:hypothetical protein
MAANQECCAGGPCRELPGDGSRRKIMPVCLYPGCLFRVIGVLKSNFDPNNHQSLPKLLKRNSNGINVRFCQVHHCQCGAELIKTNYANNKFPCSHGPCCPNYVPSEKIRCTTITDHTCCDKTAVTDTVTCEGHANHTICLGRHNGDTGVCQNHQVPGMPFCETHKCMAGGCSMHRLSKSYDYCYGCRCIHPGCSVKHVQNSLTCLNHACKVPECDHYATGPLCFKHSHIKCIGEGCLVQVPYVVGKTPWCKSHVPATSGSHPYGSCRSKKPNSKSDHTKYPLCGQGCVYDPQPHGCVVSGCDDRRACPVHMCKNCGHSSLTPDKCLGCKCVVPGCCKPGRTFKSVSDIMKAPDAWFCDDHHDTSLCLKTASAGTHGTYKLPVPGTSMYYCGMQTYDQNPCCDGCYSVAKQPAGTSLCQASGCPDISDSRVSRFCVKHKCCNDACPHFANAADLSRGDMVPIYGGYGEYGEYGEYGDYHGTEYRPTKIMTGECRYCQGTSTHPVTLAAQKELHVATSLRATIASEIIDTDDYQANVEMAYRSMCAATDTVPDEAKVREVIDAAVMKVETSKKEVGRFLPIFDDMVDRAAARVAIELGYRRSVV